jgi:hypothetical protein
MLSKYLEKLKSVNPKKYMVVLASIGVTGVGISSGLNQKSPEVSKEKIVAVSKDLARPQSQRDNKYQPHRTCNTSSNAMYLDFYRELMPGKTESVKDDDYLDSVMKRGDTTVHEVQTASLKAWGLDSYWDTSGDISKLIKLTEQGYPTTVNILHRGKVEGHGIGALRGGHVILIRWYNAETKKFTVSDPYGNLAKGYPAGNVSEGNYEMSLSEFKIRWQRGSRYLTSSQIKEFRL